MENSIAIAIFGGLGGMLGWGLADFFAKKTIDESDDLTTLFWAQTIGILPVLGIFLANPKLPHLNSFDPLFLVAFGVFGGLSYLLLYNGFGKGEVSLLSPIFASYAAVVVLISTIFFGEKLGWSKALAISIVFAGILLMNTNPRELKLTMVNKGSKLKGVPEVFTAMLVYSLWLVFFDRLVNGKSWVFFILAIRVIAALTLLMYAAIRKKSLKVKNRSLWKYLAAIGIFDVMAYGFVAYGFSHTSSVSVVAVLSASFSLPTIVLAHLFLKEKLSRWQAAAAAVILAGVAMVSVL
jgi:drug/metabolite transporter (DMT)-like permease